MRCAYTNRGTGGDAAILEEAAYIRPDLVYQVVLPVLNTGCALIAISTVSPDQSNFLAKMVQARDGRGNPVLNTIDLKLVCDSCLLRDLALKCKHMLGQLPAWQQRGRHETIQKLMETDDQSDTFLVEMRGVTSDGMKKPAFDPTAVRELRESPDYIWTPSGGDIKHIFVALDPSAGGAQSEYAVVSAFEGPNDELVICGAEAGEYKEQRSCASMLINHLIALRRDVPGAANARIVFIPESNLGFEALWVTDEIRRCGFTGQWRVMIEDANRGGVKTNRPLKHSMVLNMNMRLARRRVYRMSQFVSVGDSGVTPDAICDRLMDQLKDFMRKVKPPRDLDHGMPTVSYSGKGGYGKDDLCMSLLILDIMRNRFWSDREKYGDFY